MSGLIEMKEYALRHGLCGEYAERWNTAETPEQLMMIATDANGLPFMAEAFSDGWALTETSAVKMFGDYINGRWQANHGGYTSEIWLGVRTGQKIVAVSTATLIANCDIDVDIPAYRVKKLYIAGRSRINVTCMGTARISIYGKNADVHVSGYGKYDIEYVEDYKWR